MSAWEGEEAEDRATLDICALVPLPGAARLSPGICGLRDPVIRGLFGDAHVVYVAFTYAGVGDAHKHGACTHLLDIFTTRISHCGTQSARKLMEDLNDAALVGNT